MRRGLLSLTFVAGAPRGEPPRVAYAVGRRVGPAVVRNRIRRRLRHALAEHRDLLVADGAYLVIPRPGLAEIAHAELSALVADVLRAAAGSPGRRSTATDVLRAVTELPGSGSDGADR